MDENKKSNDDIPAFSPVPTKKKLNNPKNYFWFLLYLLPAFLTFIVGRVIVLWTNSECASIPEDVQGACGVAWLALVWMPILFIALIICWLIVLAGIIHVTVSLARRQERQTTRALIVIIGIILSIMIPYGGFMLSWMLAF